MTYDRSLGDSLKRVYEAGSRSEIDQAYDEWAESYDADIHALGWCMPPLAAELLTRLPRAPAGAMLHAGGGAEVMGEILAPLGYTSLAALDPSSGMLELARRKGAYTHFHEMYLGPELDLPDAHFAGVVAVGVFTPGHAGPDGFDELVRVTKPGGPIVFSIRVDGDNGIGHSGRQDELVALGKWRELERSEPVVSFPKEDPDVRHQLFAYSPC